MDDRKIPLVIEIESPKSENHRPEEVRTAVHNDGQSLGAWLVGELRWGWHHFVRIVLSVMVFRLIHRLIGGNVVNEKAYRAAPDLWTHGYQEKPDPGYRIVRPMREKAASENPFEGFIRRPAGFTGEVPPGMDELRRPIVTIQGYNFYLQRDVIDPMTQRFPCVLRYRTPCRTCYFYVIDEQGTEHCVAREALRRHLEEGEEDIDLADLREELADGPDDDEPDYPEKEDQ